MKAPPQGGGFQVIPAIFLQVLYLNYVVSSVMGYYLQVLVKIY